MSRPGLDDCPLRLLDTLGSGAGVDRSEGVFGDGSLVGFAERSRGSTCVIARGVGRRACCGGTELHVMNWTGRLSDSRGERWQIRGVKRRENLRCVTPVHLPVESWTFHIQTQIVPDLRVQGD